MTKKELFETVSTEVKGILEASKVAAPVVEKVMNVITTYLEPKKGGAKVDLEEVVKRDKDGNITHILDAVTGYFLPANAEVFYEAKNGGIEVNGVALKRHSRIGERIMKTHNKTVRASIDAITQDVLDGKLKPEEGKAKVEALKAKKPDYSVVAKEIEGAIKPQVK